MLQKLDSLLTAWAQTCFYLHEQLKRHDTFAVHRRLMKSQWLSLAQLKAIQQRHAYQFLNTIFKEVPFYQPLAIKFNEAESLQVLKQLPIMTKASMTENFEALVSSQARHLQKRSTGGSTGTPFQFMLAKRRISHDIAAKRRATKWWGVDIGQKELVVWGSPVESDSQGLLKDVRDKFLRSTFIPSAGLSPEKAGQLIDDMVRLQPAMLYSYPSILHYLSKFAKNKNIGCKVAFVTSEMLESFQTEAIEQAFGVKVANGYGGRDLGFVAHACMEGSMHLSFEDMVVEILDEAGNPCPAGVVGEIVITHLQTHEFPFVRYRSGDFGALSAEPCACGRGLPWLAKIEGRVSDLIYAQDGQVVHRNQIIQHVSKHPAIEQFIFEQFSLVQSTLTYTGKPLSKQSQDALERAFQHMLGADHRLQIVLRDRLLRTRSGKHRFIISHMTEGAASHGAVAC